LRPTFHVTPFSSIRSPTPSRSKISSVRLAQQIAREPTETTLLSSSTTLATPRCARSIAMDKANGPRADDGDGASVVPPSSSGGRTKGCSA
jgi:hypothetical protein